MAGVRGTGVINFIASILCGPQDPTNDSKKRHSLLASY